MLNGKYCTKNSKTVFKHIHSGNTWGFIASLFFSATYSTRPPRGDLGTQSSLILMETMFAEDGAVCLAVTR